MSIDAEDISGFERLPKLCQISLTTGGRDDGVGILGVGGDLGDPAIVADQGAAQLQCLGHLG